jgi:hypothetical protein
MQGNLFPDNDEARQARDEAMAQVAANAGAEFFRRVNAHFRTTFRRGQRVTGEDIKVSCEAALIFPHHHNAWGPAVNRLIKAGALVPTGQTTTMKTRRSHARRNRIYEVRV